MSAGGVRSRRTNWVSVLALALPVVLLSVIQSMVLFPAERSSCVPDDLLDRGQVESALGESVVEVSSAGLGGCEFRLADATTLVLQPPYGYSSREVEYLRGFDLSALAGDTSAIVTADGNGRAAYRSGDLGETITVGYDGSRVVLAIRSTAPGVRPALPGEIRSRLVALAQEALDALPVDGDGRAAPLPVDPDAVVSLSRDLCPELVTIDEVETATGFPVTRTEWSPGRSECRFHVDEPGVGSVLSVRLDGFGYAGEADLVALRGMDLDAIQDFGTDQPPAHTSAFTEELSAAGHPHSAALRVDSGVVAAVQAWYYTLDADRQPVRPDVLRPALTALTRLVIARL